MQEDIPPTPTPTPSAIKPLDPNIPLPPPGPPLHHSDVCAPAIDVGKEVERRCVVPVVGVVLCAKSVPPGRKRR